MAKSACRPSQLEGWDRRRPTLESLPGQRPLFREELPVPILQEEAADAARRRRELFYTGKDLPGARETAQVILWDVA